MPGFLDEYGVADARRERLVKRIIIFGGSAILLAVLGYYTFRTYGQERIVSRFLGDLKTQQYQDAYKMWCPENCKYYPPEEFLKDWGPSGQYARTSDWKVEHVDYCDGGVVFDLNLPDDVGLWVNRSTNVISFNPTPRCPGRHLQIGAFLKSLFS